MINEIPKNVINPFSDAFLEIWQLYKFYRKYELDGFEFKGVISEQMALKKLVEVSGGDEERAIRIVEQTIASGKWTGFYPLKTTTHKENGKSKKQSTARDAEQVRSDVQAEFNKRFGGDGQEGGESHLKAV